jgi:hypothetical protein
MPYGRPPRFSSQKTGTFPAALVRDCLPYAPKDLSSTSTTLANGGAFHRYGNDFPQTGKKRRSVFCLHPPLRGSSGCFASNECS